MCFKCKVRGWHRQQSCEERQRKEVSQDVQFCPGCGVPTVRSEGCSHIICVCGRSWTWRQDPLLGAIEAGQVDAVRQLLAAGNRDVNTPFQETGDTPLHTAVAVGASQVVKLFLDQGANLELQAPRGSPPLP